MKRITACLILLLGLTATATLLGLSTLAAALAGPFTPVTHAQYEHVHHGQTRWHIEHRVFDDATGLLLERWRTKSDVVMVAREYRMASGAFLDITYRRTTPDAPLREVRKQIVTD